MGPSVPEVHWHDQTHFKSLAIVEGDTMLIPAAKLAAIGARPMFCRLRWSSCNPEAPAAHHRGASIELRTVC